MYSGKALAVFVGIGPLIGAIGSGGFLWAAMPIALIPIYITGGIAAILAWAIHASVFSAINLAVERDTKIDRIVFGTSLLFWSALVGAFCGFITIASYSCVNSWIVYPRNCVIDTLDRFWGISILPGMFCGAFVTPIIWARRHSI